MASTVNGGALSVTLRAVDGITAPLARINASALRVQSSFSRLGSNVARVSGLTALGGAARGVARSMAQIIPPLSALTAAGSVAGVVHLASRWAAFGTQLSATAYRVQTSVSGLLAMQGAARLAGASAEDMTSGMEGLGDALSDAVGGRDGTALQYFQLLGIAMRDAEGKARSASAALPEVADGIARISDPRLQARVMSALRLPASLLPFLKQGSAGLRAWEADARRFGLVTEQGAEAAKKFELAQTRLQMAGEGLVNTIAQRLAPVISPLLERLANWIAANREMIGQKVEEIVTKLAGAVDRFVSGGGLQKLGDQILGICRGVESAIAWMGGWETAAKTLGAVLALQLLSPLTGIVGALGALGAFRLPIWVARLLGVTGAAGITAAVGGVLAMNKLGEQRDNSPEKQAEQRRNFGTRGALGGFYGAPAVDPGGADAPSVLSGLTAALRRNLTPGGPARSYTREEATERQREAFGFFREKGWTAAQSAGVVANLRHESGAGLDHQARGDGGRAFGLAQWHPDRQRAFRLWAGKPIQQASFQEQLGFVHHELAEGSERAAGEALRGTRTAAEAGAVVSRRYERPKNTEGEAAARARTATAMLPQLAAPAPAVAPPGAPPAPFAAAPAPATAPTPAATAAPPAAPANAPAQQVDVRVRLEGLPPGTRATTTTRSEGGVRVERAMAGGL
jgi:hypothetical protein